MSTVERFPEADGTGEGFRAEADSRKIVESQATTAADPLEQSTHVPTGIQGLCLHDDKVAKLGKCLDSELEAEIDVTQDPLGKKLFQYLVLIRTEVGELDAEVTLSTDNLNLPSREIVEKLVTGE
jgi:hypothetical protein